MKYAKAIVAALTAALTTLTSVLNPIPVWVPIALSFLGAVGVYLVPNAPAGPAPEHAAP